MMRRFGIVFVAIALYAWPAAAQNCGSYPNTLTNGQVADASQVMANFTAIRDCVNGLGAYLSSEVLVESAVTLSSNAASNVTSITLTPGDWEVSGNIAYAADGTTVITAAFATINDVSGVYPTSPGKGAYAKWVGNITGNAPILQTGPRRFSVTVNTTVYLIAVATFSTSSLSAFGFLQARKVG